MVAVARRIVAIAGLGILSVFLVTTIWNFMSPWSEAAELLAQEFPQKTYLRVSGKSSVSLRETSKQVTYLIIPDMHAVTILKRNNAPAQIGTDVGSGWRYVLAFIIISAIFVWVGIPELIRWGKGFR